MHTNSAGPHFPLLSLLVISCGLVTGEALVQPGGSLPIGEVFKKTRCTSSRTYGMVGYDCSDLNLSAIPTNLKSDVEILEASFNRIRELRNDTFARYTSVRFLYLGENMIQNIETGAFAMTTSLEVLDLSINAITTLPTQIFELPKLRKLYVYGNILLNVELQGLVRPIAAPLEYLNMADCHLNAIPNLGILPDLKVLNLSGNPLSSLSTADFAPFCALDIVKLNNTKLADRLGPCNCKFIENWFRDHDVTIEHGSDFGLCSVTDDSLTYCSEDEMLNKTSHLYDECSTILKHRELDKAAKTTWIAIAVSLSSFLFVFIGVLYWLHRRNKKQTKNTLKPVQFKKEENSNTDTLLIH